MGILYGNDKELSQHYKIIDQTHPVIIGKELWHRITGYANFYNKLVNELHNIILSLETSNLLEESCQKLANEINKSKLFRF